MVQIAGKYQLEKSENLVEHLIALGVPEEFAKKVGDSKPALEVAVDGKTVTLSGEVKSVLKIDEEVDEVFPGNRVFKSTTTLEGDTITITAKAEDGNVGTRIYKFSDAGLVVTIKNSKAGVPEATRTYKRI